MPVITQQFDFGHASDLHDGDNDDTGFINFWGGEWRVFSLALQKLQIMLDYWFANEITLAFLTGDLFDGNSTKANAVTRLQVFMAIIDASAFVAAGGKVMMLGGNHEATLFGTTGGGDFGWDDWWTAVDAGGSHVTIANAVTDGGEAGPEAYTYDTSHFRFLVEFDSATTGGIYAQALTTALPIIGLVHDTDAATAMIADSVANGWNHRLQALFFGHNHQGQAYNVLSDVVKFGAYGSTRSELPPPFILSQSAHYIHTLILNAIMGTNSLYPNVQIVGQAQGVRHNKGFQSGLIS